MSNNERIKILWIEDDFYHLKGLIKPLIKEGFQVINAKSYEDAIKMIDTEKNISLVILDLIIPYSLVGNISKNVEERKDDGYIETATDLVENGAKLFYHIKEKLKVPIIILSVVQNHGIVQNLVNDGANKKVQKLGLLPPELKSIVFELLNIEKD